MENRKCGIVHCVNDADGAITLEGQRMWFCQFHIDVFAKSEHVCDVCDGYSVTVPFGQGICVHCMEQIRCRDCRKIDPSVMDNDHVCEDCRQKSTDVTAEISA